ncbi:MAG: LysM peptidoglycan-binding domain-containing protein [Puniceicoccaceae bacterium]
MAGILLGSLTACSPSGSVIEETDERAYRRGKSLLREGRKDEALQAFLAVIGSRSDATESHLEAGLLYLNHLKDPLAAIFHFRTYLALNPEGEYAEFVRDLILTAQKDYAKTLPGEPFGDAVDRVNLMETVKNLQEENESLKQSVLQLQRQINEQESELLRQQSTITSTRPQTGSTAEVAPIIINQPTAQAREASSGQQSYTVQAGDTLSRISAKVYGESSRWTEIFEANRDLLPSPNALKPGQVLRIP